MRCSKFPKLYASSWLDNKPVYFLACGVSTQKTAIKRKEKSGSSVEISCPDFVVQYNNFMNGVDAHDQLRLQRYSVQRSLVSKKYYKSLFYGLFDMALVNAYIIHRLYCQSVGENPMSHANFRVLLHAQLIMLTERMFREMQSASAPDPTNRDASLSTRVSARVTAHHLEFADDKQPCGKARCRVCKVCSLLHTDVEKPIGKTRAFCSECSSEKSRVFLCDRIRGTDSSTNQMTCFQIWHELWKNGTTPRCERRIRMRPTAADENRRQSIASHGSSASYDFF